MCVLKRTRLLHASEEGYTESYIICPAAIVGPSTGPVPSASFFFHFMTQLALGFKKAIYVGEGSNIFYTVRVLPSLRSGLKPLSLRATLMVLS